MMLSHWFSGAHAFAHTCKTGIQAALGASTSCAMEEGCTPFGPFPRDPSGLSCEWNPVQQTLWAIFHNFKQNNLKIICAGSNATNKLHLNSKQQSKSRYVPGSTCKDMVDTSTSKIGYLGLVTAKFGESFTKWFSWWLLLLPPFVESYRRRVPVGVVTHDAKHSTQHIRYNTSAATAPKWQSLAQ